MIFAVPEYGNRPRDVRARPCAFVFRKDLHPMERKQLEESRNVVWRAHYDCSQTCRQIFDGEDSDEDREEEESDDSDNNDGISFIDE
jgi:hypothetical protein